MIKVKTLLDGVEGWCTLHKAEKLYELALADNVRTAVEIGVFAGKSLFPIAAALKAKGFGSVYGIEAWDNDVAVEFAQNEVNDSWWKSEDLIKIKRDFLNKMIASDLAKQIRIVELPSDAAVQIFQTARFFGKIDLLHIDGSHTVEQSVFDSAYWLRLCAPGAQIVLDDINWSTVTIAFEFLKSAAELVYSVSDETRGHFAIFRKRQA